MKVNTLSIADIRALCFFSDHAWHRAPRGGPLSSATMHRLVQWGLVERCGTSRTLKPSAEGYSYRLTEAGQFTADSLLPAQAGT